MHIIVLGGGITGLSSAFYLSRRFPRALITLLEQSTKLGGWVSSDRVNIGSSTVLLESGPRTLRPNAKSILELINLLNLQPLILVTPKSSTAAKTRFLHLPGTSGLVAIPSSPLGLLTSPLRSVMLPGILKEPFRAANRGSGVTDESFDSLMKRRFGERFARTFGSALVHGVYAADSRELSVRAAFPSIWDAETRGGGSVVAGFLRGVRKSESRYDLGNTQGLLKDASVFSFRDGISTLTDALQSYLQQLPNVQLYSDARVHSVSVDEHKITAQTSLGEIPSTHIVSALPLPNLHTLLTPPCTLPHLTTTKYASVTLANLVFPSRIHPPGFGYLIPRPPDDYNPSQPTILGTVFDSCALSAQDTGPETTKMTVMIRGIHRDLTPETLLRHLALHLGHTRLLDDPLPATFNPSLIRILHHKECIPTPAVGHLDRMEELRQKLLGPPWNGRLEVIGAGVGGVSLGDCVEAGRNVGERWDGSVPS